MVYWVGPERPLDPDTELDPDTIDIYFFHIYPDLSSPHLSRILLCHTSLPLFLPLFSIFPSHPLHLYKFLYSLAYTLSSLLAFLFFTFFYIPLFFSLLPFSLSLSYAFFLIFFSPSFFFIIFFSFSPSLCALPLSNLVFLHSFPLSSFKLRSHSTPYSHLLPLPTSLYILSPLPLSPSHIPSPLSPLPIRLLSSLPLSPSPLSPSVTLLAFCFPPLGKRQPNKVFVPQLI
jgi:hypothetical protein